MGTLHPEVSVPMELLTRFNLPKGHRRRFRLMPLLLVRVSFGTSSERLVSDKKKESHFAL